MLQKFRSSLSMRAECTEHFYESAGTDKQVNTQWAIRTIMTNQLLAHVSLFELNMSKTFRQYDIVNMFYYCHNM